MSDFQFDPLPLDWWRPTRDTLHRYTKVMGYIRRQLSPPEKHWWHAALRLTTTGLTTTPIPAGSRTFELLLDCTAHQLYVTASNGDAHKISLTGQSARTLADETGVALLDFGLPNVLDRNEFDDERQVYETTAVTTFWRNLVQIDTILKEFRATFRGETGPVLLWPHHFDLAFLWLTGRLVPGQAPANADYADEQMNFGFSTGDESIPAPYFYATAYPKPDSFTRSPLPEGAYWKMGGWIGAVLPYAHLLHTPHPRETLLSFLRAAHAAGVSAGMNFVTF
jgi:hypothetical protein